MLVLQLYSESLLELLEFGNFVSWQAWDVVITGSSGEFFPAYAELTLNAFPYWISVHRKYFPVWLSLKRNHFRVPWVNAGKFTGFKKDIQLPLNQRENYYP